MSLSLRERAVLIARARRLAVPVASRVAASIPPDDLLNGCSWHELAGLVVVLAEAADPVRLRGVAEAHDGPLSSQVPESALIEAHRLHRQYKEAGRPVPARIAVLERAYQRHRKQAQKQARQREVDVA